MKRAIRIIGEMLQFMMMASRPLLARFAFLSWCHNKRLSPPVTGGLPSGFQFALLVVPAH